MHRLLLAFRCNAWRGVYAGRFLSGLIGLLSVVQAQPVSLPGPSCGSSDPNMLAGDRSVLEGRHGEASAFFAAALAGREWESAQNSDRAILCLMDRLATALTQMGRFKEALRWSQRAVERSTTSPPNQTTALLTNNLAVAYLELGDLDAAEQWAREAFRVVSQTTSLDHPNQQLVRTTLASIHAYRGDFARAEPLYRSALFHLEKFHGPGHIEVGLAAGNLADIYAAQERHAEALGLYRKAVAAMESMSTAQDWNLLWARSGLMVACTRTGRKAEADSLATAALDSAQRLLPASDLRLSTLLHRVALVKISQQDHVTARSLIERVLPILEAVYGGESARLIAPLQTYAHVLRAMKDRKAARGADARIKMLIRTAPSQP